MLGEADLLIMDTVRTLDPTGTAGVVLLLGQDEPLCQDLEPLLRTAGFRVVSQRSVQATLAGADQGDLLLIRARSVGDHEISWVEAFKNSETAWHLPALVVANQAPPEAARRCAELGAADCLCWPAHAQDLLARVRAGVQHKRRIDELIRARQVALDDKARAESLLSSILPIAAAMAQNPPPIQVLEMILVEGMRVTNCEAGSIYVRTNDERLRFVLVRNEKLGLNMGGSAGRPIEFEPLRLYTEAGQPNARFVANYAALTGGVVTVADAYAPGPFDFSGAKEFDARTGYRSRSFLTAPLKGRLQRVIGVLQLINARDPATGALGPFSAEVQPAVEGLAVLAAAVMERFRQAELQNK
jgi:FixJ family two-component response regulator